MRVWRNCMAAAAMVALAWSAADAAKSISYAARFKAKYPAVADGGAVGILNFAGTDGENFADALAGSLQAAELDGRAIFTVKTLDSMNYRGQGELTRAEVAAAIKLGQQLGVATVFTGRITAASVTTSNYSKSESYCAQSSGLFKCESTATRQVPCTKLTGIYSVSPRAVRVAGGDVVFSENVTKQAEYSSCNGVAESGGGGLSAITSLFAKKGPTEAAAASPDALLAKLREQASAAIRELVAPYNRTINVTLKDKAPGLPKADGTQFANAVAFGNAGRMDRACSIFETINTPANATNVALLYNMGVCQEVLLPDEPAAALEFYAKADQQLAKPDKMVSDAYLRTKALVGESRAISRSIKR